MSLEGLCEGQLVRNQWFSKFGRAAHHAWRVNQDARAQIQAQLVQGRARVSAPAGSSWLVDLLLFSWWDCLGAPRPPLLTSFCPQICLCLSRNISELSGDWPCPLGQSRGQSARSRGGGVSLQLAGKSPPPPRRRPPRQSILEPFPRMLPLPHPRHHRGAEPAPPQPATE